MNPPSGLSLGFHVVGGFRKVLLTFWVLVAGGFLLLPVVTRLFGDEPSSLWENIHYGAAKYFFLALGVTLTIALLPVLVGHGVTRRRFEMAGVVFAVFVGLSTGLVVALGYQAEGAIYRAFGWSQDLVLPHLFSTPDDMLLIAVEAGVLAAVHTVVGWLIGSAYYRWRGWGGSLFLPVALLPVVAAEVAIASAWVGAVLAHFDIPRLSLPLALGSALGAGAIALMANHLLVRDVPIRLPRG